jgi:hypothetical protein
MSAVTSGRSGLDAPFTRATIAQRPEDPQLLFNAHNGDRVARRALIERCEQRVVFAQNICIQPIFGFVGDDSRLDDPRPVTFRAPAQVFRRLLQEHSIGSGRCDVAKRLEHRILPIAGSANDDA